MENGKNAIIDIQIVKYIGLFKILNPHGPKLYNINIFKLVAKIEIFFLTVALIMIMFSMYYTSNDANRFIFYLMLLVGMFDLSLNHFYVIKNSDAIWDFMSVMKIDFLSLKTIKLKNLKYKLATSISLVSCFFMGIAWIFLPFYLQQDNYLTITFKNDINNYRYTPLNLITPVTEELYDKYFSVFYVFDVIIVICCIHIAIFYDFIVLTTCICIECQLKIIANSYSTFAYMDRPINSKHFVCLS